MKFLTVDLSFASNQYILLTCSFSNHVLRHKVNFYFSVQVIEHRNSVIPSRLLQQDSYFWSVNVTFEQRWVTYMAFWGKNYSFQCVTISCMYL